ncbi:hypothetical protein DFAR_2460019 [Desulfarculales bacterium]
MAFNRRSQFDKAIADTDMAIRLDPEHSTVYYNRSYPRRPRAKLSRPSAI